MKLYYSSGACSLSPHIVALEAGIALSLEKVDGKAKRTEGGADFWQVNPKGYVPALVLDNGELLTEGPAIVQYLADLKPESALATHPWLLGDRFTAADAYLFTVTNWAKHVDLDLSGFPAIQAFQHRMLERPAVQEVMDAEGLARRAAAA
jgi:glutathione S-transferase